MNLFYLKCSPFFTSFTQSLFLIINKLNIWSHLCTFNLNIYWIHKFIRLSESLGSFKWVKGKLKYFKLHLSSHTKTTDKLKSNVIWNNPISFSAYSSSYGIVLLNPLKRLFLLSTSSSLLDISFLLRVTKGGSWEHGGQEQTRPLIQPPTTTLMCHFRPPCFCSPGSLCWGRALSPNTAKILVMIQPSLLDLTPLSYRQPYNMAIYTILPPFPCQLFLINLFPRKARNATIY